MPSFRSLGDLSTSFLLNRQTANLKFEIQRRSTELSTGITADISAALRGDFRAIAAIESGLSLAKTDRLAIAEAQSYASAAQVALDVVQNRADASARVLLQVPDVPTQPTLDRAAREIRQAFEAVVGALNEKTADRAIFAGDMTDGTALAAVDTMLADLELAIVGQTTAAGVAAAVDAWFDTPGIGFDVLGYTGSDVSLAPFRLGSGETTSFQAKASDPEFREMMKGLAMGALLTSPSFVSSISEKVELSRTAAERVLTAQGWITDVQATIGAGEAAAATAQSRTANEATALQLARVDLIGADPFEAATKLENAQVQLETLFALTARVSRLSLVDFLR